jgi:dihydroxy-acid dehydratase
MTEALGLSLPGCATMHAVDARKMRLAKKSGMKIVELV